MVEALVNGIYHSGIAEWMRTSVRAMPIVEGLHLLSMATVFGTILIVDLRLLGIPETRRAFTRVSRDVLPWTWAAFAASVVTGALMFAPNAITYAGNAAFLCKMAALLLAGLNMAVFELLTRRGIARWDQHATAPAMARVAAIASIALWVTVIILGRWTGFTKGFDFTIPSDAHPQFEYR